MPPQHEYFTWTVGNQFFPLRILPKEDLPRLIDALIRFSLDPAPNTAPFLA